MNNNPYWIFRFHIDAMKLIRLQGRDGIKGTQLRQIITSEKNREVYF